MTKLTLKREPQTVEQARAVAESDLRKPGFEDVDPRDCVFDQKGEIMRRPALSNDDLVLRLQELLGPSIDSPLPTNYELLAEVERLDRCDVLNKKEVPESSSLWWKRRPDSNLDGRPLPPLPEN